MVKELNHHKERRKKQINFEQQGEDEQYVCEYCWKNTTPDVDD